MQLDESVDQRLSSKYVDLLSERLGGCVVDCSDDWFANCENLIKSGRGEFKPGYFVSTGQLMDGWETRRTFRRQQFYGGDVTFNWCVIRIGAPGIIYGFDVDTNHFRGNAPEEIAIDATNAYSPGHKDCKWTELVPKSPIRAHRQNLFDCDSKGQWNYIRLRIYPDGGVARLRAYGDVKIRSNQFVDGELIDLASTLNGGKVLDASDAFFSSPQNLLMPGRGKNMGDGWETKRRRDLDHDWVMIQLGIQGTVRKIIIDTAHFKGNFPDSITLEGANIPKNSQLSVCTIWQEILSTPLHADQEHLFIDQILAPKSELFTHIRLNLFPDGGVSRLRIIGSPNWSTFE